MVLNTVVDIKFNAKIIVYFFISKNSQTIELSVIGQENIPFFLSFNSQGNDKKHKIANTGEFQLLFKNFLLSSHISYFRYKNHCNIFIVDCLTLHQFLKIREFLKIFENYSFFFYYPILFKTYKINLELLYTFYQKYETQLKTLTIQTLFSKYLTFLNIFKIQVLKFLSFLKFRYLILLVSIKNVG